MPPLASFDGPREKPGTHPKVEALVMQQMQSELDQARSKHLPPEVLRSAMAQAAASYQAWSEQARTKIATHATALIRPGASVFTFTLSETVLRTLRKTGKMTVDGAAQRRYASRSCGGAGC